MGLVTSAQVAEQQRQQAAQAAITQLQVAANLKGPANVAQANFVNYHAFEVTVVEPWYMNQASYVPIDPDPTAAT
ncbi:MAG TPA: hypothetical protein VE959_37515 [Bryobacteraceae bacterium]|nr:hypothetical protein [Bryobacteraceae bacterium]